VTRLTEPDPGLTHVKLVVFDFDGVFTDNAVYVAQDGTESVRCWRGDGIGLDRLRRLGLELAVISTEVNPVVSARCAKLRLPCVQGSADKLAELQVLWERLGLGPDVTCYLGNDVNDAQALDAVAVPAVVADAHPEVVPLARLQTAAAGGHGAVRELCDRIASAIEADRDVRGEDVALAH
jgi:3-deoxy-D-manno-octulosonate 8-phosphate phosphatase (KDO 8-P phosphatase)